MNCIGVHANETYGQTGILAVAFRMDRDETDQSWWANQLDPGGKRGQWLRYLNASTVMNMKKTDTMMRLVP